MISHRYARANARDMENYDASKRNSYIMYLDTNNLYGWAMSQPLPTSNFKWLTDEEREELDVKMIPEDSPRGYILECDLGKYYFCYLYIWVYFIKCNVSFRCISEYPHNVIKCNVYFLCISEYPHELHDLHKDYLLGPERLQIEDMLSDENMLSDYQRHLLQDEGFSKPPPKLVPNLHNKTNCIIHYRNLKLYLELGLRLTNVHRVLLFDQSPWLKNYINFNTRQRAAAKNDFEKDFFKLINNAVFEKSFLFICSFMILYIDSFIVGKVFIFMIICSYVLIHSLQAQLLSLCLFVLMYSFIHSLQVKQWKI